MAAFFAGSVQMAAMTCSRSVVRSVAATAALRACCTRHNSATSAGVHFNADRSVSTYRNTVGYAHSRAAKEEKKPKMIWEGYKRRHKGEIPPKKTRLRCKRNVAKGISGTPCPICANDIEIEAKDAALLNQFICPHSGKVLPASKTGLCRLQQKKLVAAIMEAWDYGYIPRSLPRHYSFS